MQARTLRLSTAAAKQPGTSAAGVRRQRQRQSSTDPTVQFEARIASLGASGRF
jgi:hypothetical protein